MTEAISRLQSINANSFSSEEDRKEAVNQARALLSRIESPWDTAAHLCLTVPAQIVTLKVASDLGLFQKWLESNDGNKLSMEQLCNLVKCDIQLLQRTIRHLGANHMIWVDSQGFYEMSPFAKSLVKEDLYTTVDYNISIGMPAALYVPTFLKETGYHNPDGKTVDCFQHWKNQSVWDWVTANPSIAMTLGAYMKATGGKRGTFSEFYPCEDISCDKNEPLIVDIGGSMGHDLQGFRNRYPNATGKLILQDLPNVIENAKKIPDHVATMEMQGYDFFAPQPIIGAKFYLLHAVLHDWADTDAKRILETLRPALKKGHSKLLIHEIVIPEVEPDVESTSRDMVMMMLASGVERTEGQWKSLLTSTGYKINKIYRSPLYAECVIETELA